MKKKINIKKKIRVQNPFNGKHILIVSHDRHLGNFISTDILNRNMIDYVSDFYQRSNWACDSTTLVDLYRTFGLHLYSCQLFIQPS